MRKEKQKKGIIFIVFLLFIGASLLSSVNAITTDDELKEEFKNIIKPEDDGTEYWALLVAVGDYAEDPEQDRPLMLEEIDDLYDLLIQSEWWSEDHIKVIKGEDATVINIIKGLRWMIKWRMEMISHLCL